MIIDTMHMLPGEVLDFLSLLSWLGERAVVVLHDIAIMHRWYILIALQRGIILFSDCRKIF